MTRHGKNCTAGAVYTYYEKQKDSKKSGWGSQKARFSKDSIKDFDCCSLTLQPCKNPVVTQQGHLYDREAILEYILHQKQLNAKKMKAYEKQLEKEAKELEETSKDKEKTKIDSFLKIEESIRTKRQNPFSTANDDAQETATSAKKIKPDSESINNMSTSEKKNLPSFWIPSLTPQATSSKVEKPDNKVYCPMSNKPLRFKDLTTVKFTLAPVEDSKKSLIARDGRYICAVTRDVLSNSTPCAVLRPTGDVVTLKYVIDFIKKDWLCPITGQKLKEKDIIELKRGGTGFAGASGEELQGKVYGPTMMVS